MSRYSRCEFHDIVVPVRTEFPEYTNGWSSSIYQGYPVVEDPKMSSSYGRPLWIRFIAASDLAFTYDFLVIYMRSIQCLNHVSCIFVVTYAFVCMCIYIYINIYLYIYILIYIYVYINIYIYIHSLFVNISLYSYVYIYIHTCLSSTICSVISMRPGCWKRTRMPFETWCDFAVAEGLIYSSP